ncbi:hypothetical protein HY750_01225 [Candidatus Kuenenbacteria bacterium]|nr:hypothetical protein [Candidatus Kuenenbacteria bacterium]
MPIDYRDEEQQLQYETAMREARNKVSLSSKLSALKKYQAKAFQLRKEIGDFSITFFILALMFAGFKDLLDIFSIELFSWLDWIIDLGFGAVLFFGCKGSVKQVKTIRMTSVGTSIAEAIPIIGALPLWTAGVLLLYIKMGQENGTAKLDLESLEKKIAKLNSEIAQMQ